VNLQNKLAGICEDMCKEVGAYPKCTQCPNFVAPDSTPGVMTWDELLEHMFNLSEWGHGEAKKWNKQAANLLQSESCEAEDLKHRVNLQNKLAGICEDMCKEVGAYPKCTQCPNFVAPDSTPGVMTWEELLEHMFNLSDWGHEENKKWVKRASQLQKNKVVFKATSCEGADLEHRAAVQNRLAGICEDMCKEVGAYPKCTQCPNFVAPDSTPGVMTWEELLEHMFNLSDWGHEENKKWVKTAAQVQLRTALRH